MDLISQRLAQLDMEHAAAVLALQSSEVYRRVLVLEAAMHELQTILAAMQTPVAVDSLTTESSAPNG